MGNVLSCLPKSAQLGARAALAEIYNAEDKVQQPAPGVRGSRATSPGTNEPRKTSPASHELGRREGWVG